MRIQFDRLKNKEMNFANATEQDVIWTVNHYIQKQKLQITELTVLLFLSKDKTSDKYIITIGEYADNEYQLRQCLKLKPELVEQVGTEPLVLLRQLAENFGIEQKFGNQVSKFFVRESVKTNGPRTTFGVKRVKDADIAYSLYHIYREESKISEIALALTINVSLYKAWLNETEILAISPKKYDVFISYKRNTAKDFARHLKKCLTEEGYGAFLDLEDLSKEFPGTTKWFEQRDEAIKNSKRFLVIMTIKIGSSKEVAKELTLARGVPHMKFIYMRHCDLEPQVILKGDANEEIDLSEGNQETFNSEDDLVRKVLKILQDSDFPPKKL